MPLVNKDITLCASLSLCVSIVLLQISHTQVPSLQITDRVIPLPHRRPPTPNSSVRLLSSLAKSFQPLCFLWPDCVRKNLSERLFDPVLPLSARVRPAVVHPTALIPLLSLSGHFGCMSVVSQPCVRSVFPVICPAAPATCPAMLVVFRSIPTGCPIVCTDLLSGFWSILDVVSAVRFRRNHRCSGCLAIRLIAWLSLCISVVGLIQPSFGALFVCVLLVGLRLCHHLLLLRLRPFNVNQLCFWF